MRKEQKPQEGRFGRITNKCLSGGPPDFSPFTLLSEINFPGPGTFIDKRSQTNLCLLGGFWVCLYTGTGVRVKSNAFVFSLFSVEFKKINTL